MSGRREVPSVTEEVEWAIRVITIVRLSLLTKTVSQCDVLRFIIQGGLIDYDLNSSQCVSLTHSSLLSDPRVLSIGHVVSHRAREVSSRGRKTSLPSETNSFDGILRIVRSVLPRRPS